jgi:hypothetical protein
MNVIELNDETFLMYAIKNYDNPNCSGLTEFNDDVQRFKYLKRLFRKAKRGELKERLILNHIVVLYNLFGVDAATRMLFYKIETQDWPQLKTFLVFLNFMPESITLASGKVLPSADITLDSELIDVLRKI